MFRFIITLLVLCGLVSAQDFSVPSGWRHPSSSRSGSDRAGLAQALLSTVTPQFNSTSGQLDSLFFNQNANLLSAISIHAMIVPSNETNLPVVLAALKGASQSQPGFLTPSVCRLPTSLLPEIAEFNVDPLTWGLAALHAYCSYADSYFLDTATSIWQNMSDYLVSTTDADIRSHPFRNTTFQQECNGTSTAGAVFVIANDPIDLTTNAATTGSFMTLSARLFEATGNTTYQLAAQLSAWFIQSHLYDGTVIIDTFDLSNCTANLAQETYNSGLVIEGLSVYVNQTNNATMRSFLNDLISTSIKNSTWTGLDGIIIEGPSQDTVATNYDGVAFKGIFVRGLYEAWSRSPQDSDVAKLIQSYITVQYNALVDLAKAPSNDYYAPRWQGPPAESFLPWGQLAALDVLNSAAGMSQEPSPSVTPPSIASATTTATSTSHHGLAAGAIAGVTIGVVVVVTLIAASAIYLYRRCSPKVTDITYSTQTSWSLPDHQYTTNVTPFSQTLPVSAAPSKLQSEGSSSHGLLSPPVTSTSRSQEPHEEVSNVAQNSIPELVQRLNQAIARLPPTAQVDDMDGPPQYESIR
ncbi:unnamed protein product [Somion occarium]|uniref:Glycoside hydrolase family 76 protein n=1 Tax=Somion occarium TaxID=3059160 RepID=A0ABP1EBG8_9APHY